MIFALVDTRRLPNTDYLPRTRLKLFRSLCRLKNGLGGSVAVPLAFYSLYYCYGAISVFVHVRSRPRRSKPSTMISSRLKF